MSHDERTFPDWELALHRLGELPAARAAALGRALEDDPELAARLAALDEREAELMARLPPRVLAAQVADRAPRRRHRGLWLAAELAAVALLLLLVLPPVLRPDQLAPFQDHGVRDKGVQPYLRVFRQVPGGLEELGPLDPASPGAQLQLSYAALGRTHGVVLSIDGRGEVTLHLPLDGALSEALKPEGTVDLPASYMLDDAPTFERFFLLTARDPFELAPVLEAAHALAADPEQARAAPLSLPRSIDQADFLILKDPTP
jgi:hypothetical protein